MVNENPFHTAWRFYVAKVIILKRPLLTLKAVSACVLIPDQLTRVKTGECKTKTRVGVGLIPIAPVYYESYNQFVFTECRIIKLELWDLAYHRNQKVNYYDEIGGRHLLTQINQYLAMDDRLGGNQNPCTP